MLFIFSTTVLIRLEIHGSFPALVSDTCSSTALAFDRYFISLNYATWQTLFSLI